MRIIPDLWRFAEICAREPQTESDIENSPGNLLKPTIFFSMNNNTDYGYYAEYKQRIIIAIEGTGTGKEKGLRAWLSNLNAIPAVKGVHQSFLEYAEYFYNPMKGLIDQAEDKPVFFTGHSRGGSLVKILAMLFAERKKISSSVITFGAPTPFLKDGRDRFNKLPIDCLNVIHGYEFTRYVPPYAAGFRYAGRVEWLPEPRIHRIFYRIRDHFPSNTTKAIKKWCQKHNDASGVWVCDQILKVAQP
jgi:hypothetical protein